MSVRRSIICSVPTLSDIEKRFGEHSPMSMEEVVGLIDATEGPAKKRGLYEQKLS
jgi:hypothetical protein